MSRSMKATDALGVLLAAAGIVAAIFLNNESAPIDSGAASSADTAELVQKINTLEVSDRCSHNGNPGAACSVPAYNRVEQFGQPWKDVDGNGCKTNDDVLKAQTRTLQEKKNGCGPRVAELSDPYTGKLIHLDRAKNPTSVQIDHVVPLSLAWDSGADQWTQEKREQFANDQEDNLLAVDGPANQAKSDKTFSEWSPENTAYTCDYAKKYATVLTKYGLRITPEDKGKLIGTLNNNC